MKNYSFSFDFGAPWGQCEVTMTSVLGHLTAVEFPPEYKKWQFPPPESLFDAPVKDEVSADMKAIAANIKQQARYSQSLFIWTDCDREGEYIGSEIVKAAREGKQNIEVKRAKFSNTERA